MSGDGGEGMHGDGVRGEPPEPRPARRNGPPRRPPAPPVRLDEFADEGLTGEEPAEQAESARPLIIAMLAVLAVMITGAVVAVAVASA